MRRQGTSSHGIIRNTKIDTTTQTSSWRAPWESSPGCWSRHPGSPPRICPPERNQASTADRTPSSLKLHLTSSHRAALGAKRGPHHHCYSTYPGAQGIQSKPSTLFPAHLPALLRTLATGTAGCPGREQSQLGHRSNSHVTYQKTDFSKGTKSKMKQKVKVIPTTEMG